ncbi:MAG: chloride channel protein [Thermoplasmata archaeon]|jgi:CIC family chloride channel protein
MTGNTDPPLGDRRPKAWGLHRLAPGGVRSLYRWALIGVSVGIIAGLVAIAFFEALTVVSSGLLGGLLGLNLPVNGVPPGAAFSWSTDPNRFYLLIGLLVLGGLGTGLLIRFVAPETEGHGTDQTIRAFHRGRGVVRYRVPAIKFLASTLTLGTGGSGGREGPTAQIGSGLGSFLARPLGLTTQERRVAMMAGVGAGIGAIFKAPFGAALLSSEVLYLSDFEPEVIMPSIIASVISYSIFGSVEGFGPEFVIPAGIGWTPAQLPVYALLGLVAGLFGILYVVSFYRTRAFFRSIEVPPVAVPAVGVAIMGGILAALYYLVPQYQHFLAVGAIGIGYGIVQWMLYQGHLPLFFLLLVVALIFLKILATSLTVGSGGSAGLFGPGIVIGATIGFSVISLTDLAFPSLAAPQDVTAFAIIGMMAFFGSVSKAPIAVILMVVEMTGSEALLVPAMVAIFIGYYVTGHYHLYEEQVENRLASPSHTTEYFAEFLRHMPTSRALDPEVATVPSTASVEAAGFALSHSQLPVLAVLREGRLVGEVRLADILGVPPRFRPTQPVGSIARETFPTLTPDSTLLEAVGLMDAEGVEAVLVVTPTQPPQLVGAVTRERVVNFQRSPGAGNGGS